MWIDKVSMPCKKCGSFASFDILLNAGDSVTNLDIIEAIRSDYVVEDKDVDKYGVNCEKGKIDTYTETFTCTKCLRKAYRKKQAKKKAKK